MTSIVEAEIYSEISEFPVERRFDLNIQISKLKEKLEPITGANFKTMTVLLSVGSTSIGSLDDNEKTLAEYLGDKAVGDRIKIKLDVKDEQAKTLFEGDVPKYEISEEKYNQRSDNVRNFIKELRKKNDTSN